MLDQTDPVRDLVRRAYQADDDLDVTAGLLDVVRRTEAPSIEIPVHRVARNPEQRRHRSGPAMVATFAAAILVILVGATVASRGLQQSGGAGGGPTTAPVNAGSSPKILPTSCAVDWKLTLSGREFQVTGRNPQCPPLPRNRLYLMDAARGNGLISEEGDATVWPLSPVGVTMAMLTPPFTFTLEGWPGPVAGHYYGVLYLAEGRTPHAGDDVMTVFEGSYTVSAVLLYP